MTLSSLLTLISLIYIKFAKFWYTVKPLNSGQLPLLGGNLAKIVTFGTKHFVRYSRHVRYLGCPLLEGFTI